jgi:hypothetical protein
MRNMKCKSWLAVERGACSNARPFHIRTPIGTRATHAECGSLCAVHFRNRTGDLERSADQVAE